ncbi:hypothetical protein A1O3_08658 [Capronia epimyces CBS 606.96]|uniref:Zn(2)-C6 fungal-type domain-containing protein n=1 Tax=Capronia epimyces CBS 606.96 TaxID=1182542 RepID=W9XF67_9EURO|nr:uncharacterized protein A1O3_08658 [Capronia epimyces CBS 606.96]EXJ79157.1 hypothetical protein A1O3_08658 [Capronia epimyces CBS 606.96]
MSAMTQTLLMEDSPQSSVPEKPKRTRKTHNKVRSGCLTCKIRRKKCDEEKPFCRRCTSTGRKCDGYPTPSPTNSSEKSPPTAAEPASKRLKTTPDGQFIVRAVTEPSLSADVDQELAALIRPPSNVMFQTDNDFFCFDFFRTRTGPEFAAYFDSSIWRSCLVRACFRHPTVMAAAAAVGAVHRRFELGISREAFEYCDLSNEMYQGALKRLSDDLAAGNPNAAEINMLTMKLFSVFETFQGNEDLAQMHLVAGLKALLKRNMRTTYRDTQYRSVDISYDSLRRLFLKLELESVRSFHGPAKILSEPEEAVPLAVSDPSLPDGIFFLPDPDPYPIPHAFTSLTQARDVLFTEATWIWHTWGLLEQGILSGSGFSRHQVHISRLLQWSMAYAEYCKHETAQRQPHDQPAAQLLRVYRETAYLILLTQMAFHSPETGAVIIPLCDPPELCSCHRSCRTYAERKEALNAHFARLLVLSESVLNRGSLFAYNEHSLSMDSGIGPPLYLGAPQQPHCRSTKVRHQVTSLLDASEIQTRVWDTLGVYSIAEKMSAIEEHAVVQCGAVSADLEPKWVDVTFFLDERRLLLRYCTPDREGRGGKIRGTGLVPSDYGSSGTGGLIWTQEWASF